MTPGRLGAYIAVALGAGIMLHMAITAVADAIAAAVG